MSRCALCPVVGTHLYALGLRLDLLEVLHEEAVQQERADSADGERASPGHTTEGEVAALPEVQRETNATIILLPPRKTAAMVT